MDLGFYFYLLGLLSCILNAFRKLLLHKDLDKKAFAIQGLVGARSLPLSLSLPPSLCLSLTFSLTPSLSLLYTLPFTLSLSLSLSIYISTNTSMYLFNSPSPSLPLLSEISSIIILQCFLSANLSPSSQSSFHSQRSWLLSAKMIKSG